MCNWFKKEKNQATKKTTIENVEVEDIVVIFYIEGLDRDEKFLFEGTALAPYGDIFISNGIKGLYSCLRRWQEDGVLVINNQIIFWEDLKYGEITERTKRIIPVEITVVEDNT